MSHETFDAPELDQLAELLPAYHFLTFIAKGGMGAVYKARQRSLDRDVAIKILPRELGADSDFRQSFESEAKAMARLNHPNLVGVYDYGTVDGMPYIVMELVNGKSLYHSAWNKAIDPSQAVRIAAGICKGLGHAHEHGIIHRDIKPANILLTPKAEPKIGDFGLARPSGSDGPSLIMGTPGYSAPEFLDNPDRADKRADVYAVGVILHELVTGERPDPTGKIAPKPTGDERLDEIWQKAVHPNPAFRYPDAEAMAEALSAWESAHSGSQAAAPGAPKLLVAQAGSPRQTGNNPQKPSASPENAPPQVQIQTGSNWSLVRNLLIIASLIVAIGFTYKYLERTKKERTANNQRTQQEKFEKEQRDQASQRQNERKTKDQANNPAARPKLQPKPPEPKVETSLDTLQRLRSKLARGERDEMPLGTKRRGDSDYLLVTTPMTWHEAAAFAEDHGGHLAVVTAEEDVTWFTQITSDETPFWIGAGRAGRGDWIMVDGSDWPLAKAPGGAGSFAALDPIGLLRARKANDLYPFVIQWQRDGSNPATLSTMLGRTRESLENPTPIFPPGTIGLDARHFLLIPRAIDRRQALQLAEQAGGLLAVPASRDEASRLAELAAEANAPLGLWLGASRSGAIWKWDTNETWEFAEWASDADQENGGSAMVLVPGKGWKDADPEQIASGLIIEWSSDFKAAQAKPEEIAQVGSDMGALKVKAAELINAARKEHHERLAANARTYVWDLNVWLRGLKKSEADKWTTHVDELKKLIVRDRVPVPNQFGPESTIELSIQMAKICAYGDKKQNEYDVELESKLTRIRKAYLTRLNKSATTAEQSGQAALAREIREQMSAADDLSSWADSLTEE